MTGVESLAVAGTLIGGASTISQTLYQGAVAQANAKQAELNAQQAVEVAQQNAQDQAEEDRLLIGAQIASQGASGLALSSPTSIRSRFRTRQLAFEDQKRLIDEGLRQNANFRTQANEFRAQSRAATTSAVLGGISTAIGARQSFLSAARPTARANPFIPKPLSRSRVFVG